MLRNKSLQYFVCRQIFGMLRKKALIAQMAPAAHHREIHADKSIMLHQRNDVGIRRTPSGLNELLLLHGMQRP